MPFASGGQGRAIALAAATPAGVAAVPDAAQVPSSTSAAALPLCSGDSSLIRYAACAACHMEFQAGRRVAGCCSVARLLSRKASIQVHPFANCARLRALPQARLSAVGRKYGHLPTSGRRLYRSTMDEQAIVRRNIERLLAYAKDHKDDSVWPSNKKALARRAVEVAKEFNGASGISRSTLQRTLKEGEGSTVPGVDTLGLIAGAFGLQAWHLLIPDIDPTNPPVVSVTQEERELWKRMHEVAAIVKDAHAPQSTARKGHDPGPHREGQRQKKRTNANAKPRAAKEKEAPRERS